MYAPQCHNDEWAAAGRAELGWNGIHTVGEMSLASGHQEIAAIQCSVEISSFPVYQRFSTLKITTFRWVWYCIWGEYHSRFHKISAGRFHHKIFASKDVDLNPSLRPQILILEIEIKATMFCSYGTIHNHSVSTCVGVSVHFVPFFTMTHLLLNKIPLTRWLSKG